MNILPSPSCQPFFCDRVERSNKSAYSSLAVCEISIFSRYDTGYGFPAFVPEGENTVAAELIEIPFEDWEAVDRLEGYPRLYDRLMFPAKLEDGTEVSGWVYVMHNLPEMATVIESGSWKEYRHG